MKTPLVIEKYTDNGEHSHWVLINDDGQEIASSNQQNAKLVEELTQAKERIEGLEKECEAHVDNVFLTKDKIQSLESKCKGLEEALKETTECLIWWRVSDVKMENPMQRSGNAIRNNQTFLNG